MKKRIINYRKRIDQILEENALDTDWEQVLQEHLTQVAFFQHERLIHLIVTALVAVITILVIGMAVMSASLFMGAAGLLLLVLLLAYILHYYTLENEVQTMYQQYDGILKQIANKK